MRQYVAWFTALPLMLLVIAIFVWVARGASSAGGAVDISAAGTRFRTRIFWGLLVLFIPVIGVALARCVGRPGQRGACLSRPPAKRW